MTDHPALATTRRQLGELGVMAAKTEAAERDILAKAQKRLADVDAGIKAARGKALTDDAAGADYTNLIDERGRLHQVIAQAQETLRQTA